MITCLFGKERMLQKSIIIVINTGLLVHTTTTIQYVQCTLINESTWLLRWILVLCEMFWIKYEFLVLLLHVLAVCLLWIVSVWTFRIKFKSDESDFSNLGAALGLWEIVFNWIVLWPVTQNWMHDILLHYQMGTLYE